MKRFVSIVLVIALTLCCAPMGFAEAEFDFRNTRWGMTGDEVAQIETAALISGNMYSQVYSDIVLNYPSTIEYSFNDVGKLVGALYTFVYDWEDKNKDFENKYKKADSPYRVDYDSLVAAYTEKYGEPYNVDDREVSRIAVFRTYWQTETTEILLELRYLTYGIIVETVILKAQYSKLAVTGGGGI